MLDINDAAATRITIIVPELLLPQAQAEFGAGFAPSDALWSDGQENGFGASSFVADPSWQSDCHLCDPSLVMFCAQWPVVPDGEKIMVIYAVPPENGLTSLGLQPRLVSLT